MLPIDLSNSRLFATLTSTPRHFVDVNRLPTQFQCNFSSILIKRCIHIYVCVRVQSDIDIVSDTFWCVCKNKLSRLAQHNSRCGPNRTFDRLSVHHVSAVIPHTIIENQWMIVSDALQY